MRTADGTRRTVAVGLPLVTRREEFRLARVMHFDSQGRSRTAAASSCATRCLGPSPRSSGSRTSRCRPRASRSWPVTAKRAGAFRGRPDRSSLLSAAILLLVIGMRRRRLRARWQQRQARRLRGRRRRRGGADAARTGLDRGFRRTRLGRRLERELALAGIEALAAAGAGDRGRSSRWGCAVTLWQLLAPAFGVLGLALGVLRCCGATSVAARSGGARRSSPRCPSWRGCWRTRPTPVCPSPPPSRSPGTSWRSRHAVSCSVSRTACRSATTSRPSLNEVRDRLPSREVGGADDHAARQRARRRVAGDVSAHHRRDARGAEGDPARDPLHPRAVGRPPATR